jgi:hypothetical protein
MERIKFITHKDKQILLIDFSHLRATEVPDVMKEAQQVIAGQPKQSVLTLTDITQMGFNMEVTAALKEYVAHNKPYVKASAVVGAEGLLAVTKTGVERSTERDLINFKTREEAQDWLVSQ